MESNGTPPIELHYLLNSYFVPGFVHDALQIWVSRISQAVTAVVDEFI